MGIMDKIESGQINSTGSWKNTKHIRMYFMKQTFESAKCDVTHNYSINSCAMQVMNFFRTPSNNHINIHKYERHKELPSECNQYAIMHHHNISPG